MKQIQKIAVIGGTGKAGKYLVRELIARGLHFNILLRHPENFDTNNSLITIVKGDARNYTAVRKVLDGCDAVLSMLGQPKGEPSIFSEATRHVLQAMRECHIRRYILITGLNVDAATDRKSTKTQAATDWMKTTYPETTFDKQAEYGLLTQSDVDWTLVRLPMIEQTETKSPIHISLEDCPGNRISAASLAAFVVEQLADDRFLKQAPFIANQ